MHKLGDVLTHEKIKRVLTARRNLYNAGVELLECDRTYADYMVPFEGAEAEKKQIDEIDVRFYLEMRMRIYVKEENITFDAGNGLCKIRLNDTITAYIPIKRGTAVRSILL